jgi:hypothetical protein
MTCINLPALVDCALHFGLPTRSLDRWIGASCCPCCRPAAISCRPLAIRPPCRTLQADLTMGLLATPQSRDAGASSAPAGRNWMRCGRSSRGCCWTWRRESAPPESTPTLPWLACGAPRLCYPPSEHPCGKSWRSNSASCAASRRRRTARCETLWLPRRATRGNCVVYWRGRREMKYVAHDPILCSACSSFRKTVRQSHLAATGASVLRANSLIKQRPRPTEPGGGDGERVPPSGPVLPQCRHG